MDKQCNNNINEIKVLVLQLAQQFNKKFDEQARVILDQCNRLDEQQQQIHNQRAIIDELAWQIRDLRDSVRKCSEQVIPGVPIIKSNGPGESHLKLIIPDANLARQSNHRAGRKLAFFLSTLTPYRHSHTHHAQMLPFVQCRLLLFFLFIHTMRSIYAIPGYFQLLFSVRAMHSKRNRVKYIRFINKLVTVIGIQFVFHFLFFFFFF